MRRDEQKPNMRRAILGETPPTVKALASLWVARTFGASASTGSVLIPGDPQQPVCLRKSAEAIVRFTGGRAEREQLGDCQASWSRR